MDLDLLKLLSLDLKTEVNSPGFIDLDLSLLHSDILVSNSPLIASQTTPENKYPSQSLLWIIAARSIKILGITIFRIDNFFWNFYEDWEQFKIKTTAQIQQNEIKLESDARFFKGCYSTYSVRQWTCHNPESHSGLSVCENKINLSDTRGKVVKGLIQIFGYLNTIRLFWTRDNTSQGKNFPNLPIYRMLHKYELVLVGPTCTCELTKIPSKWTFSSIHTQIKIFCVWHF